MFAKASSVDILLRIFGFGANLSIAHVHRYDAHKYDAYKCDALTMRAQNCASLEFLPGSAERN
jgi:hypothetical protein